MNLSIRELNELIYSLGITAHHGMLVNKELNESLLEKLYRELNSKLSEEDDANYLTIPSEEADEDFRSTLKQDEQRYEDLHMLTSFPIVDPFTSKTPTKKLGEGTAQSVLDYVESMGSASHKQMQDYYKSLNGSNTFAYCLKNLIIPYKNRKTQRYLAKTANGKYVVRIASIHNWVEKSY